jgi:hypothetical protein
MPGLYHDRDTNELVCDVPQLLEVFGWENTPENRDQMIEITRQAARELFPDVPQTVVEKL